MKLSLILVAIVVCTMVQANAVNKRQQEPFFETDPIWEIFLDHINAVEEAAGSEGEADTNEEEGVNKRQESFLERVQNWASGIRDHISNVWQRIQDHINSFDVDALEENLREHADRLSEGTNEHIDNIITAIRNAVERAQSELQRDDLVDQVREETGLGEAEVSNDDINFVADAVEEAAESDAAAAESEEE